jgi:hypothetical protein
MPLLASLASHQGGAAQGEEKNWGRRARLPRRQNSGFKLNQNRRNVIVRLEGHGAFK